MRIAIFGAGGVGGYFGAQLARAGEDAVLARAASACRRSAAKVCASTRPRARS
jgi:ketopantoate reductase